MKRALGTSRSSQTCEHLHQHTEPCTHAIVSPCGCAQIYRLTTVLLSRLLLNLREAAVPPSLGSISEATETRAHRSVHGLGSLSIGGSIHFGGVADSEEMVAGPVGSDGDGLGDEGGADIVEVVEEGEASELTDVRSANVYETPREDGRHATDAV